jgi:phosphate starvation-inducible PhoH-like protein
MEEETITKRLTRREKRLLRQGKQNRENNNQERERRNFNLKNIHPLTENQKLTFEAFDRDKNLMLHGIAGCGKTFLSMFLALREILEGSEVYKKIVIVQTVVPTRDMGFLPGNTKEKTKVYEAPYYAICTELFGRGDSYDYLKNKGVIEFMSTSYIRGITLNDCIVIVDEMQNATLHELDSVITRIGHNCKIIFCGDFRQTDFTKDHEKNGLVDFMRVVKNMKSFELIDFHSDDIVRSALVKEYIILKDKMRIVT